MDEIFLLLYQSMVIQKEMEELTNKNQHATIEYLEKQDELNRTIVDTIKLMVFKKD